MAGARYAVDAHAIGRHLTGNEVYVRSLLNAFAKVDRESEFFAYYSALGAEQSIPERFASRRVSGNPFARLGYGLSRRLRVDRPDLLHVQYTGPLFCPVPLIASIHDVSFLERPEYFTAARRRQLKFTVARTARSAARILTGSEFSRDSIVRAYGLDPDRVVVVPDAANPFFRPLTRESAMRRVLERFRVTGPFVLSVGDLQPRKNHIGLIEAFARLVKENPALPHELVLAGQDTWFGPRVHEAAAHSGVQGRIRFLGFVTDDDLLQLYNACDCFCFPSFYEGFGIPILEAMACGRAVACANTSAMPEVADGAGLFFDPAKPDEMVRALRDILIDPQLRQRMERLGLQRAANFTWQRTAQKTLAVYREVAGRTRRPSRVAPKAASAKPLSAKSVKTLR
ncbi:glycosyltransferase family 4 protein [Nevskia soli]|jgi:glycosyltransferase involved in cell wall biosynthesis|uniref:glycosyltransferase family 4 protein n=1 Tax=Nevskia soli TaxID=418856 RepID=UPI0015D8EEA9|nr:glycosyltransferase family 1 protein [Nevskia soli]